MRYGVPSCWAKVWLMTGCCFVACTIAQPIRWVNETFSPRPAALSASLSAFRCRSSVATDSSRNVVAVGTLRLSFMFCTSRAAGPLMAVPCAGPAPSPVPLAPEGAAGAGAWAPGAACPPACLSAPFPFAGASPTTPRSNSARHSGIDPGGIAEELLVHHLREAGVRRLEHVRIHDCSPGVSCAPDGASPIGESP